MPLLNKSYFKSDFKLYVKHPKSFSAIAWYEFSILWLINGDNAVGKQLWDARALDLNSVS